MIRFQVTVSVEGRASICVRSFWESLSQVICLILETSPLVEVVLVRRGQTGEREGELTWRRRCTFSHIDLKRSFDAP